MSDGFEEFIGDLQNANANVNIELENLLNRTSNKLLRKVKLLTPVGKVRGGTLRRSWRNNKLGTYERIISNNVEYAPHVENGHRIVRNGRVVGYVEGRYMLKRSMEELESGLNAELEIAMNNILGR